MKTRSITLHLIAETPDELSVMTVQAQEHWGMVLEFFDFSQTKEGMFICWYQIPHAKWAEAVMNGRE